MAREMVDSRYEHETGLNIDGGTIEVIVGSGNVRFYVHENVVCSRSCFFDAALGKEWAEGVERVVTLPEDRPEVFKAYLQWLYSGRINSVKQRDPRDYRLLSRMYALGEKLIDPESQDRVLDAILAIARFRDDRGRQKFPADEAISIIYDATPPGSPARRLLVDLHMRHGGSGWISNHRDDVHRGYALDLATELLKERSAKGSEGKKYEELDTGTPCSYHHHANGRSCGGDGI
ncbi:hypothetical protein LTR85_006195 [Meristemomyces frigidus]|nr:hypothetical protein LTR85_006195 [Meristemomyces frigidus]